MTEEETRPEDMAGAAARPAVGRGPSGGTAMTARRRLASVIDDEEALSGFSRVRVSMILTDARAEDNPIVYVNSAFERTTGYARSAVIGRNCRFLQGEATDKADVDRLRAAIEDGRDVTVDILNYRADGKPFTNRLIIAPISDADGKIIYFLGIQKEMYDTEREEDAADELLRNVQSRVREDLALMLEAFHPPRPDSALEEQDDDQEHDAMRRRLECLQLVYEGMKLSDQQERAGRAIDLGSLISRVAAAVAHDESRSGIRYLQQVEPISVNPDAAVQAAILASEVLANAFSHAFDRMEEGFVELRVSALAAGGLRMTVTDDGVGLAPNVPFPDADTVGGRLISRLVEGLGASITPVRGAAGTVVMIDIPADATDI